MSTRGANVGKIPKIVWGDDNTELAFGYPMDTPNSWSAEQLSSSARSVRYNDPYTDAHTVGLAWFLTGRVRLVPTVAGVTPLGDTITGWDDGWEQFLRYCRAGNTFTFFPDADETASFTAALVSPVNEAPQLEENFTRTFQLTIRSKTEITGY